MVSSLCINNYLFQIYFLHFSVFTRHWFTISLLFALLQCFVCLISFSLTRNEKKIINERKLFPIFHVFFGQVRKLKTWRLKANEKETGSNNDRDSLSWHITGLVGNDPCLKPNSPNSQQSTLTDFNRQRKWSYSSQLKHVLSQFFTILRV